MKIAVLSDIHGNVPALKTAVSDIEMWQPDQVIVNGCPQEVIEEFLTGEEASFICIVSGREYLSMASSQDHKAAYNGDEGPNTGGMGAYSPAPVVDDAMHQKILDCVIEPTVQGLADDGIEFTGFLYAGLMIGEDGIPKVLEFNCRFGDPETQPIMLRMESDLVEHCLSAVDGNLAGQRAKWSDKCALGVVLAAEGYPGAYAKGAEIFGLSGDDGEVALRTTSPEDPSSSTDVVLFMEDFGSCAVAIAIDVHCSFRLGWLL